MGILFSIIIPTLSEELSLSKTLDSIVSQRHPGVKQIIVSDNGSIDRTIAIAKEFGAVVVTGSKPNNIGSARKIGCLEAKKLAKNFGNPEEIIVAVDADTVLSSGYLNAVYKLYSRDSSVVASSGPFKTIINNRVLKLGRVFQKINLLVGAIDLQLLWLLKKIKNNGLLYGFNTVIRRYVYESVGGFDELVGASDMDLTLKVISSGNQVYYEKNQLVTTSSRKFTNSEGFFNFKKAYQYAFKRDSIKQARVVLKKRFKEPFL